MGTLRKAPPLPEAKTPPLVSVRVAGGLPPRPPTAAVLLILSALRVAFAVSELDVLVVARKDWVTPALRMLLAAE